MKGSWFLYPPGKASRSQYGLLCSVPPTHTLCPELSILGKQREAQVGAGICSHCWAGCSALKHFQVSVFSCTQQESGACTYMFRGAGPQRHSQCLPAGGKACAACMTRTGTAPEPTVGTAPGNDGEDLALLQHLGSFETLSKAAGWRGLHLTPAGWGYSSAQLEVPQAPLPHCPLTEPTKLLKPSSKSAPSDGQ